MSQSSRPGIFLLLATATLAVGPRFLSPALSADLGYTWFEPLQHAILFVALLTGLPHSGRYEVTLWPVLAATLLLGLTPMIGAGSTASPQIRVFHTFSAWLILTLPWLAALPRRTAPAPLTRLLVSLAPLSAVIGIVLHFTTDWLAWSVHSGTLYRLQGATRADYFAGLAFGGVLIAIHEWSRRGDRMMGIMATVNAILLIYSGSRTAMISLVVWGLCFVALSKSLREKLRAWGWRLWLAFGAVTAAFVFHSPVLRTRMSGLRSGQVSLSGREPIWSTYLDHFQSSPWFGLGLGSAQPGALHELLPHNEFLRLLVEGGIVGATLYIAAIIFWARQVCSVLDDQDRPWFLAFMIALPVYSLTDNPISACYIVPFLYLGTLMSRKATAKPPALQD